jgi:hypothetical protein
VHSLFVGRNQYFAILIFCVLIGFQNCSEVRFDKIANGTSETSFASMTVGQSSNGHPAIVEDLLQFKMNSSDNMFALTTQDNEDGLRQDNVYLSTLKEKSVVELSNGTLRRVQGKFSYTPKYGFRGTDNYTFVAEDSSGLRIEKLIRIVVGNVFHDMEPAMAIRGAACTTCHAQVSSTLITDSGAGDANLFMAIKPKFTSNLPTVEFYNIAPIFGDVYGFVYHLDSANKKVLFDNSSMSSAQFDKELWIPKNVKFPSSIKNLNAFLPIDYLPSNEPEFLSQDLASYLRAVESKKKFPAKIVEKSKVYIGAPTTQSLIAHAKFGGRDFVFYKNDNISSDLRGLSKHANGYFYNGDGILNCDGDLFVDRTLFLKNLTLHSKNGCRIYSTHPVFVQGGITMRDPTLKRGGSFNLQIVSSRAILMGIGRTHCETQPSQWYFYSKMDNPLMHRLVTYWGLPSFLTRNVNPAYAGKVVQTAANPQLEGQWVYNQANAINDLQDASCTGRTVHFERLLLNAPLIHSRYAGNFKGVVIGEVSIFSLGKFKFEFDPIFKTVPVLPYLDPKEYLDIQE